MRLPADFNDWPRPAQARLLARYFPVDLIEMMGDDPWAKQAEIIREAWANREVYVASCHASGKTWLEARVLASWALAYYPDVLAVVIAPTEDQVTAGVWRELQGLWPRWSALLPGHLGVKQWRVGETGVVALGRSPRPERPGTLQGLHSPNMLVIVDEAPEVDPELWAAIRSLLTGANTRLLAAGNPTRTDGEFFRAWTAPEVPGVAKLRISAFDTPNLAELVA